MNHIILIALGGAIGSSLRYMTGLATAHIFEQSKVITGTVISNGIGCLFGGILLGWISESESISESLNLFLTIGLLGSYTTFSAFTLEVTQLIKESWQKLMSYLFLQLMGAFILTAIGFILNIYFLGGVGG